ncbi:hypothetical protein T03_3350 [Trichinella britovi]|uniref:Uncharacterized protein n=1 Tax=Trichinella britovi TaxID=45882 RepID=A0A0V1C3Q2_TRIBR|nr:hypothetical protein T03_3350 [Trichinella britovi]
MWHPELVKSFESTATNHEKRRCRYCSALVVHFPVLRYKHVLSVYP